MTPDSFTAWSYDLYLTACWPLLILLGVIALFQRKWAIMRCILVLALGQLAIDAWFNNVAPEHWDGQPWAVYLGIYTASAVVVTVRPAGKTCSVLGGIFIGGIVFSLLAGYYSLFPYNRTLDVLYWKTNLVIGILSLFVVSGGSAGETGRRIVSSVWGRLANLAHPSRNRGLA